jgi:hypothetical protein
VNTMSGRCVRDGGKPACPRRARNHQRKPEAVGQEATASGPQPQADTRGTGQAAKRPGRRPNVTADATTTQRDSREAAGPGQPNQTKPNQTKPDGSQHTNKGQGLPKR